MTPQDKRKHDANPRERFFLVLNPLVLWCHAETNKPSADVFPPAECTVSQSSYFIQNSSSIETGDITTKDTKEEKIMLEFGRFFDPVVWFFVSFVLLWLRICAACANCFGLGFSLAKTPRRKVRKIFLSFASLRLCARSFRLWLRLCRSGRFVVNKNLARAAILSII